MGLSTSDTTLIYQNRNLHIVYITVKIKSVLDMEKYYSLAKKKRKGKQKQKQKLIINWFSMSEHERNTWMDIK